MYGSKRVKFCVKKLNLIRKDICNVDPNVNRYKKDREDVNDDPLLVVRAHHQPMKTLK